MALDTFPDGTAAAQEGKTLLRFITCGSVDDGKSTLIGRLLHDTGSILEDQRAALEADSRRLGRAGLDLSLLVDGLAAEREQGITIDVAHRFFSTARRKFIVADTPGPRAVHPQHGHGASTPTPAVILVDATRGCCPQTRRHTCLMALVGVREVALAVNKMDQLGFDQATYEAIPAEYDAFARRAASSGLLPSRCRRSTATMW
jgi:bifunctional enzyme CysN/CysC